MLRPTEILCKRLEEASRSDDILNMKHFYAAVTQDIINDYCFARDPEYILRSDFGRKSFDDLDSFLEACLVVWLRDYCLGSSDLKELPYSMGNALHLFPTSTVF